MTAKFAIQVKPDLLPGLLGPGDMILRRLEQSVRSRIVVRGDEVIVEGPPEEEGPIRQIFKDLEGMAHEGQIDLGGLNATLTLAGFGPVQEGDRGSGDGKVVYERPGLVIRTRSANQEEYVRSTFESELVFAEGPAGTGKTYIAVALAVRALMADEVDRIILVRPVVEAGEHLGFLPGDLEDKVEPYFRPLYDALIEMITPEKLRRFLDQGRVEVAPLAYMRGRTLDNAFVILDEAQNTTSGQLKMFLTRLGARSKSIVTGDLSQIDLLEKSESGLAHALVILKGIRGIRFVTLDHSDVVRHPLVREIIQAYENRKEAQVKKHNGEEKA